MPLYGLADFACVIPNSHLYVKTPQERYDDLINRHPDLFDLFSLKDIASFLNITPTHLSRLRKNDGKQC